MWDYGEYSTEPPQERNKVSVNVGWKKENVSIVFKRWVINLCTGFIMPLKHRSNQTRPSF